MSRVSVAATLTVARTTPRPIRVGESSRELAREIMRVVADTGLIIPRSIQLEEAWPGAPIYPKGTGEVAQILGMAPDALAVEPHYLGNSAMLFAFIDAAARMASRD